MKKDTLRLQPPSSFKYFIILASIVLTVYVLVVTQSIIKPLLAAFVVAMLLKPICSKIESFKVPRALSTVLAMLIILSIIGTVFFFLSTQVANVTADLDNLIGGFNDMIDKLQAWAAKQIGVAPGEQIVYLKSSLGSIIKTTGGYLHGTISATAGFFSAFVFFVISLFFFLYYRDFIFTFMFMLFSEESHPRLSMILVNIENVVRRYIWGLFLVILVMATMNITGLLLLGIKHAIFFGAFGALLTIIPYIGILIGSLLPAFYALATMDSIWYPIGVILIFSGVQFLEGNFITPNIIGNQVSINPFAALLGLFLGAMLFGIVGIIFAIPLLAICKVVFDSVESLQPLAFIIGNPPNKSLK